MTRITLDPIESAAVHCRDLSLYVDQVVFRHIRSSRPAVSQPAGVRTGPQYLMTNSTCSSDMPRRHPLLRPGGFVPVRGLDEDGVHEGRPFCNAAAGRARLRLRDNPGRVSLRQLAPVLQDR